MKYQLPLLGSSLLVILFSSGLAAAAPKSGESSLLQLYGRRLDDHESRISDLEQETALPAGVQTVSLPKTGKFSYTVKQGETITAISKRTGVSAAELMRTNKIKDERLLRAGQILTIPGKAPAKPNQTAAPKEQPAPSRTTASSYTVRSGDNITKIAKQLGTTPSALAKANGFSSTDQTIRVGQTLVLPGAKSRSGNSEAPAGRTAAKTTRENYEITGKETFYSLSRRYNVSVEDLMTANPGVNPNALRSGMRIVIPVRNERRDSIEGPGAALTQKSPAELPDARTLHVGGKKSTPERTEVKWEEIEETTLPAPTAGQDPHLDYEVQPGETWDSIARDFFTTPVQLKSINQSKSAVELKPGEFILVPRDYLNKSAARRAKMG